MNSRAEVKDQSVVAAVCMPIRCSRIHLYRHCLSVLNILKTLLAISLTCTFGLRAETLKDAWNAALQTDHLLTAAKDNAASSHDALSAAKTRYLPRVTTDTAYTALDTSLNARITVPSLGSLSVPVSEDRLFFSRTGVQIPIYTGGATPGLVKAANAGARAADLDISRTELDIKIAVTVAYLDVLRSRKLLEVAESSVKSLNSYRQDVANLYDQGMVARNDLLAAQVALADARQNQLRAKNATDLAEAAYNRAVGRPLDTAVHIDDITPDVITSSLQESTASALAHRPEIAEIAQQTQAAKALGRVAIASMLPQIGVSGGYNYLQNKFLVQQGFWSVSAGLQWNIFDFGEALHRSRALQEQSHAMSERELDIRSRIELEVRKAWLYRNQAHEQVKVANETIGAADENLKVARDRYDENVGNGTEVLEAETLRVRARNHEANSVYDEILASFLLRRATGEL